MPDLRRRTIDPKIKENSTWIRCINENYSYQTSTLRTVFLPLIGLVHPEKLKLGDLVGVNKDSHLVLNFNSVTLPAEFDSRVKAMEVNEP